MGRPKILAWGTADFGKPRTRILLTALKKHDVLVDECFFDVWSGVEDKSQIRGNRQIFELGLKLIVAYPILIFRYLMAPRHDAVFVGYFGHLDVIVLWPFAKLRGAKIVWDAFLSVYDTAVEDRKILKKNSFAASILRTFEKLSCLCADVVLLDTNAHASYFEEQYEIVAGKTISVWVGAETDVFVRRQKNAARHEQFQVLFYGQFISLHGIEHIVDAARNSSDKSIQWTIIGRGQEKRKISKLLEENPLPNVKSIDWVAYEKMPTLIADADLCLGIFGDSDKASRVIPNKVFQIISVGTPIVTRDSPAVREILAPDQAAVWLVPPASGQAIADAVVAAKARRDELRENSYHLGARDYISPDAVAQSLIVQLEAAI